MTVAILTDSAIQKHTFSKLSSKFIKNNPDNALPKHFQLKISCSQPVHCRYYPSKTVFIYYGKLEFSDKRAKTITIGDCDLMTIAQAITKIENIKRNAKNPQYRTTQPFAEEFERFMTLFLATGKSDGSAHRSPDKIKNSYKNHISKHLCKQRIADITTQEIFATIDDTKNRCGQEPAKQALTYLKSFFEYFSPRYNLDNPMKDISGKNFGFIKNIRQRVLDEQEIVKFLNAVDAAKRTSKVAKIALKLQLLLANRVGELSQAHWSEFDLNKCIWTVPADHTKAGRAHKRPLPQQAIDLLKELFIITGNDKLVLAGLTSDSLARTIKQYQTANKKGQKVLNLTERVTLHDLRRTAITIMSTNGADTRTIKHLLSHKTERLLGTYDKYTYFKEQAEALQDYASFIMPSDITGVKKPYSMNTALTASVAL